MPYRTTLRVITRGIAKGKKEEILGNGEASSVPKGGPNWGGKGEFWG